MDRRNVAVFIDGVFRELHRGLITQHVASAYASGMMIGSGLVAPFHLLAYVLPDDEDAMLKEQPIDEVERALKEQATPEK